MKNTASKIRYFLCAVAVVLVGGVNNASAILTGQPTDINASAVNAELQIIGLDAMQLLLTGIGIGLVIFAVIFGTRKAKQGARTGS